jgi:transposase
MLSLPASVRIYLATEPCDMRKGFDSLAGMVRESFGDDPLSGHLFVFRSRRADRVKILWWDRDGYAIWMKRLEAGTFRVAGVTASGGAARAEIPRRDLAMLLEGIDPKNVRKSRRFACATA